MPFLGKTPTVGNFILLDAITVSNTATFALTKDTVDYYPGSAQNMIVSVNGVTQAPLTAYTITDSNIIFSSALDSDVDVIDYILVLGDTLNIGRPSDSTVGATQLQDYAVTSVKMSNTGVGAATYGTSTSIPQITIDAAGRITSATGIDRSNQFEDLTVTGNLTVSGNTVTVDAQTLSVEDPLIHLASNNETSDVVDIGFIGHYSNDGGTTKLHTGFFRDASDEQYYLFNGFEDDNLDLSSPSTTIDRTANTFALANLNTGKITATVDSNIAATFSSTTTTAKITLADANDQAFIDINASRIGIGHASSTSLQALQIEPTSGEAMRIDSAGDVGIGVSTPAQRLDVREEKTGGGLLIQVYNTDNSDTTTQTAGLALGPDSRGATARITAVKENADFSTNAGRDVALTFSSVLNNSPTERMRIDSIGNVGIGTDNPLTALHVGTTGGNSYSSTITKNSNMKGGIFTQASNGNDMVGVYFATGSTTEGSHWSGITGSRTSDVSHWGTQLNFYTHNNDVANLNDATQKMVIKGDGKVGIGTTSPNARLHVRADVGSESIMRIRNENTTSRTTTLQLEDYSGALADGVLKFVFPTAGTTTGSYLALLYNSAGLYIAPGGNVGIGTSSPSTGLELSGAGNTSRLKLINGSDQINFGLWDNTNYRLEGDANRKILITSYHTDGIHLGGSGSSDLVVKGGNVGIGTIPGTTHRVTIAGAGGDRTQPLEVLGTGTSNGFSWLISGMQQNLSAGHRAAIFVGKSESTYNSGGMYHYHAGDGSASNELRWGLFAADDLMRLSTGGNLTLSGSIISSSYYKIQTWSTTITSGASYTVTLPYRQGSGVFTFASDYNPNAAINARWLGHVSGRYGSVALTSTNIHTGPSGSTSYSLSTSYDGSYYQTITYTNNNNANQTVWFAFYGLVAS